MRKCLDLRHIGGDMENVRNMQDQKKPWMAGLITFCTATAFVLTVLHVHALSVKVNLFPDSQFHDSNDKPGLIGRSC